MKASNNNPILSQRGNLVSTIFHHPEKKNCHTTYNLPVFPVFMPFAGCKTRCVFCSQELQTGIDFSMSPAHLLREADNRLAKREESGAGPVELAFYGGTFTALPLAIQDAFLDLAEAWKKRGMVKAVRCSTRPDAVDAASLDYLAKRGMTLVEFGAQSFSESALSQSGRHYTGDIIDQASLLVKKTGLLLGIQLMPGMPGVDKNIAEEDVQRTLTLNPDVVRLYPCLVIQGTELEQWWRKGVYSPWSFQETKDFLVKAVLAFWDKGIHVIRMGVAPSDGLDGAVVAGPAHPSLGSMVRGSALFYLIEQQVAMLTQGKSVSSLSLGLPAQYQGELFGYRGELKAEYERIGFPPFSKVWQQSKKKQECSLEQAGIFYHDKEYFSLTACLG